MATMTDLTPLPVANGNYPSLRPSRREDRWSEELMTPAAGFLLGATGALLFVAMVLFLALS